MKTWGHLLSIWYVDKAAITRKVSQNKATALLPTSFRISNAYFWACPVWSDSALIKNEEVSCGVFAGKFIESISEMKQNPCFCVGVMFISLDRRVDYSIFLAQYMKYYDSKLTFPICCKLKMKESQFRESLRLKMRDLMRNIHTDITIRAQQKESLKGANALKLKVHDPPKMVPKIHE